MPKCYRFALPLRPVAAALAALGLMTMAAAARADTARFGSRVIVDGDSAAQVRAVAGEPQIVKPAPAAKAAKGDKAAAKGEQWFYRVDNRTVAITLRGGVVTAIATTHGGASGKDAPPADSAPKPRSGKSAGSTRAKSAKRPRRKPP